MNCKKGDMAIVVGARNPANLGKIVTCLEYVGTVPNINNMEFVNTDCWLTDGKFVGRNLFTGQILPFSTPYCSDSYMMPITPDSKQRKQFRKELKEWSLEDCVAS